MPGVASRKSLLNGSLQRTMATMTTTAQPPQPLLLQSPRPRRERSEVANLRAQPMTIMMMMMMMRSLHLRSVFLKLVII